MIYYFDNCATTKTDDDVLQILNRYQSEDYFNPSSLNKYSLAVNKKLSAARDRIKKALSFSGDVYFTSGGTESDNLAVLGAKTVKGGNVVCNAVEHSAVYNAVCNLKNKGFEVRFAKVTSSGHCDFDSFLSLCDTNTFLAICMHVNNETGAVNDIKTLFEGVKAQNRGILCFSDGVQAAGKIPVNLDFLGADLYSLSSHKLHCTKGMGALLVKKGVSLNPQTFGGGQENGVRNGTEYVAGAIAMSYALEKAVSLIARNDEVFAQYKQCLVDKLKQIPNCEILCEKACSPAIFTIVCADIKGEVLLHMLEQEDIIVGHGSSCSSKSKTPRIINELKLDKRYHEGLIRISFSKYNTYKEVDFLADRLCHNILRLRNIMGAK